MKAPSRPRTVALDPAHAPPRPEPTEPVTAVRPAQPPAFARPAAGFDSQRFLKALRRCWKTALPLALLAGAVAAYAAATLVASRYTAYALLHVSSSTPRILLDTEGGGDIVAYRRTQAALVKSRLVLRSVLDKPEVQKLSLVREQSDQVGWLEKQLKADYSLGPEILMVSLNGDRPAELATLVNTTVNVYLQDIVHRDRARREAHLQHLKQVYKYYEDSLQAARRRLQSLAESADPTNSRAQAMTQQLALDRLSMAERELMQVQSELSRLETELHLQEGKLKAAAGAFTDAELRAAEDEQLRDDEDARRHTQRLAQLRQDIEQVVRVSARGADDPLAVRYRAEERDETHALDQLRARVRPAALAQLRARAAGAVESGAAQLKERIAVDRETEKNLTARIKRLTEEAFSLGRSPTDVASLRDDITQAENMTRKIGMDIQSLQVELGAPPRINLLEAAEVPRNKDLRRQLLATGCAGGGAFGLVFYGLLWRAGRSRRVRDGDDVTYGTGLPILATLPALPDRPVADGRAAAAVARQPLGRALDRARTLLLHGLREDGSRVVLVTSSGEREGKTALAGHLALWLARAGCRTLLVDADLGGPAECSPFDTPGTPGLGELLRAAGGSGDRLGAAVRPTGHSNLWVVPAGEVDEAAAQALTRGDARGVFDRLRDEYDFVLLDGPAFTQGAEPLVVAQYADVVVFSVRAGVTDVRALAAARQELDQVGVPVLGAVVSEPPPHAGRRYHLFSRPHAEFADAAARPEERDAELVASSSNGHHGR